MKGYPWKSTVGRTGCAYRDEQMRNEVGVVRTKHGKLNFLGCIMMEAISNHLDVSENSGTPKSSIFYRVFHYKPSILGYPYFWKHPSLNLFQRLVHKETIFGKYVSSIKPCKSKKMSRNFIFSPKTCWSERGTEKQKLIKSAVEPTDCMICVTSMITPKHWVILIPRF